MARPIPGPLKSKTLVVMGAAPEAGVKTISNEPASFVTKSVAWKPKVCVSARGCKRRNPVLIAKRVPADGDWLFPSGNETGDVCHENGFAKDGAAQNVANGSVWGFPHLFQGKLLDTGLIRGDCGTLYADIVLLDCLCRVHGDLVVCLGFVRK